VCVCVYVCVRACVCGGGGLTVAPVVALRRARVVRSARLGTSMAQKMRQLLPIPLSHRGEDDDEHADNGQPTSRRQFKTVKLLSRSKQGCKGVGM
jgi:hypothetical protein